MAGNTLIRVAAVAYLAVQSIALVAYWLMLWLWPSTRARFTAPSAPDATVMAFAAGDLLLYASASAACAIGIARRRTWLPAALWLHSGAAVYAALYALSLAVLVNDRWLGAMMMAPALVVSPLLVVIFGRTRGGA